MKGNIYSRLWIPKPCHEDWNKMTPDEKGAFCKSCNKSVYDFTTKNEEQVEAILTVAKGEEVCGRFNSKQLAPLPELEIPIHALPQNLSPYRRFVLAVFIVFGTALFGCVNSYGQKMGKVKLTTQVTNPPPGHESPSIKGEVVIRGSVKVQDAVENLPTDTPVKDEPRITMGDTIVLPEKVIESNLNVLGGVAFIDYNDDPVKEAQQDTPAIEVTEETVIKTICELSDNPPDGEIVEDTRIITCGLPGLYADVTEQPQADEIVKESILSQKDEGEEIKEIPETDDIETGLPVGQNDHDNNKNAAITSGDGLKLTLECYPNPSAGQVNIRYEIKKRSDVKMELFDRTGKKVRILIDQKGYYNGIYNTSFDLSDLDAGTYICVLQAGEQVSSAKVVIAK